MTQKIEGLLINPTETKLRTGDKANMTKNWTKEKSKSLSYIW